MRCLLLVLCIQQVSAFDISADYSAALESYDNAMKYTKLPNYPSLVCTVEKVLDDVCSRMRNDPHVVTHYDWIRFDEFVKDILKIVSFYEMFKPSNNVSNCND